LDGTLEASAVVVLVSFVALGRELLVAGVVLFRRLKSMTMI
jgi:hypothetical protein